MKQPLVLVVDDNRDEREMYANYLAASGFRVATGGDGEQALLLAHESHSTAIVMDLSMPHVDGCEATRRLKRDPLTRDIRVIACTGRVADRAAEPPWTLESTHSSRSPVCRGTLLSVLRSVLEKLRFQKASRLAAHPAFP